MYLPSKPLYTALVKSSRSNIFHSSLTPKHEAQQQKSGAIPISSAQSNQRTREDADIRGWARSLQEISGSWTNASSMAMSESLLWRRTDITISHVDRNIPSIRLTFSFISSHKRPQQHQQKEKHTHKKWRERETEKRVGLGLKKYHIYIYDQTSSTATA